jgi:hypothetical protein
MVDSLSVLINILFLTDGSYLKKAKTYATEVTSFMTFVREYKFNF